LLIIIMEILAAGSSLKLYRNTITIQLLVHTHSLIIF